MHSVAARPRIKDVAEYAGVSPKTVSNVINDFEHVSDRTREVVKEAIDALGYRVNIAGRQLRRGRIGMITLAVPELDVAYFAELATHVMAEAGRRGQTVLLHRTGGVREQELAVLQGFDAQISDGVILSPLALHARDLATRDRRLPVVLLGERPAVGGADHVAVDNVRAAREATEHLLSRGRRRIAVVGGRAAGRQGTDRLRTDGHREALKAADVAFDPDLVVRVDAYHREYGAQAAAALMERRHRPDALLCLNDDLALGALRALYERRIDVPGELDVVGFDDIEAARFSVPSLTTVSPDKLEIARASVTLLLDRIDGLDTGPLQDHVVGHEVIVRESTGG
ncbi:HTH-type transcriptional regulator DegA [Streptomyces sp. YIM 130001]|uniref:LacI family DNA-binding transcriptional regulator n=1 Tax=Streptomyces sp. YIM 130001 TaxID=2259644 RepID=UPI000E64682C|nr:LacI family DNA-binding transcriptional regulator [Streptomyces sp. YIM 130001]RII20419.1 HTH-type transcriptional regulator DegA [Streptomyces sp. YIM 130001]